MSSNNGDDRAGAPAQIVVTTGAEAGRRHTVVVPAVLGRGDEATVVLDEPEVSRRHAEIRFEGGRYIIEDLGSRNGTRVGGETVRGPTPLSFGAAITLGTQLELLFTEPDQGQEEALRRQRLETVSRLLASVARDLGDKLCAAMASLDYLRALSDEQTLGASEVVECLEDLGSSLGDSMELLPHLNALEQRRPHRDRVADVSRVVRDLVSFVGRSFAPDVEVASKIEPGLQVKGDSVELYHALLQLCVVVRDEMRGAGRLFIGARKKPLSRFDHKRMRVVLTVRAGEATTPVAVHRPSTRLSGELEAVPVPVPRLEPIREVVTLHGGRLRHRGQGVTTSFHIELANVEAARSVRTYDSLAAVGARPTTARGTVVVAHDEKVVRRSIARVLGAAGVEAVSCRRAEVLDELGRCEGVQVVVLEDGPATDAGDLLSAVGDADPAVKIVLMAGRGTRRRGGMAAVIRPPWTADTVVAAVERHLEPVS